MDTGSVAGASRDAVVGSAMTTAVGAEVGADVGTATGSDFEVGVADPLHPTTVRMAIAPTKSGANRQRMRLSSLDFPLVILIQYAALPVRLGVAALVLPRAFWVAKRQLPAF